MSTTYTAWLTTARDCLETDYMDVVVLELDEHGSYTGGGHQWKATTSHRYDDGISGQAAALVQATELLKAAEWTTEDAWVPTDTGYVITVTKATGEEPGPRRHRETEIRSDISGFARQVKREREEREAAASRVYTARLTTAQHALPTGRIEVCVEQEADEHAPVLVWQHTTTVPHDGDIEEAKEQAMYRLGLAGWIKTGHDWIGVDSGYILDVTNLAAAVAVQPESSPPAPRTIQDAIIASSVDLPQVEQDAARACAAQIWETARNVTGDEEASTFSGDDLLNAIATIRDNADAAWRILNEAYLRFAQEVASGSISQYLDSRTASAAAGDPS